MNANEKLLNRIILFLAVLALFANHFFGYIGHYGYDDLHYAKLANDLSNGLVNLNDNYTFRISLIALTSLSYKVFGISDFASSLPSLIITSLILILVYFVLRKSGRIALITGLSLTLFSKWFLFYSDKLMPDIFVAFAFMLALFILDNYKFRNNGKNPFLYASLFALSLLFGLASKETIVLIMPLLIYLIVVDITLKRDIRFWIYSVITGLALLCLYFATVWILTGDITTRFKAIAAGSYLNQCSYDKEPLIILLRRISYEFIGLLCNSGIITAFVILISIFFQKQKNRIFRFNDSFSFYFISAFILLLSSNFMSISLKSYVPLCLDPRHYLFLVPIAAIPASLLLTEVVIHKSHKLPVLAGMFIVVLISFFPVGNVNFLIYLLLFIAFSLFYFLPKRELFQKMFPVLFMLILSIPLYQEIKYASHVNYNRQKEIAINFLLQNKEKTYVLSNDVQKRLGEYYSGFKTHSNTEFLKFGSFNIDTLDARKKLLVRNWYTEYLSKVELEDLPYYASNLDNRDSLVFRDEKLNISIYKLNNEALLEKRETVLFSCMNDFEIDHLYWNQNSNSITDQIKFSGSKASEVNEFSASFSYPFDSLYLKNTSKIILRSRLYCNFLDKTKSQIVISMENEKGVYLWKSLEINKYLRAYSNWSPVKFEISVATDEIKPHSTFKTYLWNIDKQKGYIDDFEVSICRVGR